jgi:hypothetical protein
MLVGSLNLNEEKAIAVYEGNTHLSTSWHAKMSLTQMNGYRVFLFKPPTNNHLYTKFHVDLDDKSFRLHSHVNE